MTTGKYTWSFKNWVCTKCNYKIRLSTPIVSEDVKIDLWCDICERMQSFIIEDRRNGPVPVQ